MRRIEIFTNDLDSFEYKILGFKGGDIRIYSKARLTLRWDEKNLDNILITIKFSN